MKTEILVAFCVYSDFMLWLSAIYILYARLQHLLLPGLLKLYKLCRVNAADVLYSSFEVFL